VRPAAKEKPAEARGVDEAALGKARGLGARVVRVAARLQSPIPTAVR